MARRIPERVAALGRNIDLDRDNRAAVIEFDLFADLVYLDRHFRRGRVPFLTWAIESSNEWKALAEYSRLTFAQLFTAAKVSHLNLLPQGRAEKNRRSLRMVAAMDEAGFGNCSNHGECEAVCPKEISLDHIARLNRNYNSAKIQSWFRRTV